MSVLDAYDFTMIQVQYPQPHRYTRFVEVKYESSKPINTENEYSGSGKNIRLPIVDISRVNPEFSASRFPGDCSFYSFENFYCNGIHLFVLPVHSWQNQRIERILLVVVFPAKDYSVLKIDR